MAHVGFRHFLVSGCVLGLSACSMQVERPDETYVGPERSAGSSEKLRWIGAHADELVEELGDPEEILNATLLGGPDSVALVYTNRGTDGCIDAYVVVRESGRVVKYFCR